MCCVGTLQQSDTNLIVLAASAIFVCNCVNRSLISEQAFSAFSASARLLSYAARFSYTAEQTFIIQDHSTRNTKSVLTGSPISSNARCSILNASSAPGCLFLSGCTSTAIFL